MRTNFNRGGWALARRAFATLALACSGMALAPAAHAAAPLAGSVIGNQASATYTDASQVQRIATSNVVQTVVQQVSSFTLVADQNKMAAPGQTVYFPHTLTNTGNGSDTFGLSAANTNATGEEFDFSNITMYADANGDGVPDNAVSITSTGALAAGGVFKFVVAATVPGTRVADDDAGLTVTATDTGPGGTAAAQTNTDTVKVTGNAVISVTKTLSQSSGPSPSNGNITVTLTYTNTGNSAATDVTITDVIGSGATAGMRYVPGSAKWNGVGLNDATGTNDPAGSSFEFNDGATLNDNIGTVSAVIGSVGPNVTGTLTFQVSVNGGVAPGTAITSNTASFSYDPDGPTDGTTGTTPPTPAVNTNTAVYRVLQAASVLANDVGSSTDNPDADDDVVKAAAVAQGATVSFENVIHNKGNGVDTFNIRVDNGVVAGTSPTPTFPNGTAGFPAGTTFLLFKADGVTPLVDTNGDGIPDTGPVDPLVDTDGDGTPDNVASATYKVIVKAVLPASATAATNLAATVTATSTFDPSKSDQVYDYLAAISGSTVDLRNGAANTAGAGADTGTPVTLERANPGGTVTFLLQVNNTSLVADSYNLSVSGVPTGWTVVFREAGAANSCTTVGPVITNTGVINGVAGGVTSHKTVCAVVTVAANEAATSSTWNTAWETTPPANFPGKVLTFLAKSPTTGAEDAKKDGVFVNTVRGLTVLPNNSNQVFPGGTVVYSHTLANTGNVSEGAATALVTLSRADNLANWTSVVYWDANSNGVLDATDPVLQDLSQVSVGSGNGLDLGESTRIFVKVFAPASAAIGDIDLSTVTVTIDGAINGVAAPAAVSAQDTTSVIAGQVRLIKEQVLVNCTGGAHVNAGVLSNAQISAEPGACIKYRITAINEGAAEVRSLVLSDATPASTKYWKSACPATTSAGGAIASPAGTADADGFVGTVAAELGTLNAETPAVRVLAPAAQATLTFCVRIDAQ